MTKFLSIRPMIREDFHRLQPADKHEAMAEFARSENTFLETILANKGAYALVDEDDHIYMLLGGHPISHCTYEVWLIFGTNYEQYVKSCIKALRVVMETKVPPGVHRLEANVIIEDTQAINLLEKCLKFGIVGIRRKAGPDYEDVVLLERIL